MIWKLRKRYFKILWPVFSGLILLKYFAFLTDAAIVAPPWANPKLNPCASQPRGWQLLFWPPDGKCYKIFQMGYPCPDDMELSPPARSAGADIEEPLIAECKCPPKTALSLKDGKCHELFSRGPCERGQYFAPYTETTTIVPTNNTSKSGQARGSCQATVPCTRINELFWPATGHCYPRLTQGPCTRGQLLTASTTNVSDLAQCRCTGQRDLNEYRTNAGCFQHYTRGPCREKGHLFLPDRSCGCGPHLPHWHDQTEMCFEIGSIGPCNTGEHYQLHPITQTGYCSCKNGYIRYKPSLNQTSPDGCYRPFTQGPCPASHILVNATTCIKLPCARNELFFPPANATTNNCHRIGTQGPCRTGHVVTFDFRTRPSLDGISYNGLCACASSNCRTNQTDASNTEEVSCESDRVLFRGKCYKLYGQGPCARGAWLVPRRRGKKDLYWNDSAVQVGTSVRKREGYCDCMPGYTKLIRRIEHQGPPESRKTVAECLSPTVLLADYLNKNFFAYSQVDNDRVTIKT